MLPIKTQFSTEFLQDEERALIVSERTKRLWAVVFDLLIEFDRVCKKNNITYFLDSGTLLGAVRHKGFIPWDDDIDVIMTREEYEKLCTCAGKEFILPYFFQNNETDPGSMRGHAQLRNSLTTGILKAETVNGKPIRYFNQGIFIDVFILDKIPDDDAEYEKFAVELARAKQRPRTIRDCKDCAKRLLYGHIGFTTVRYGIKGIYYWLKDFVTRDDSMATAYRAFDRMAQRYRSDASSHRCASITLQPLRPKSKRFPVSMFSESCAVEFEGRKFPAPRQWDEYLIGLYGDWHEHVIGSGWHGGMIIDTERPYTEYLKR